jgi:hypothetical protein
VPRVESLLPAFAAQAAPRSVRVVAKTTRSELPPRPCGCIHLDGAYCQLTSNARH